MSRRRRGIASRPLSSSGTSDRQPPARPIVFGGVVNKLARDLAVAFAGESSCISSRLASTRGGRSGAHSFGTAPSKLAVSRTRCALNRPLREVLKSFRPKQLQSGHGADRGRHWHCCLRRQQVMFYFFQKQQEFLQCEIRTADAPDTFAIVITEP